MEVNEKIDEDVKAPNEYKTLRSVISVINKEIH